MTIRNVSIVRLKANLPELLRQVKTGQQFLVTKHGRPAALIIDVPVELLPPEDPDASFEEILNPKWARTMLLS